MLRVDVEIPDQVLGTEKKTPSSFEVAYNLELSPQLARLAVRRSDKEIASKRRLLIPRFCPRTAMGAR